MSNNNKAINFIKKNVYYFVFILSLAILSIITIALVVSSSNASNQLNNDNIHQQQPSTPNENGGNNQQKPDTPDVPDTPDTPTVNVIVFDMPVAGTIIKEYVGASVVYNQTLGLYTGHKAIDFGAEEGTSVKCVYNGVIESITVSNLDGTTITVDHGNGLKSVYNSIEANAELIEGQSVLKGDVLGTVSTNNKKEYKDGAHLHFEVLENGQKVDPEKYLLSEEK